MEGAKFAYRHVICMMSVSSVKLGAKCEGMPDLDILAVYSNSCI